MLGKLDVQAVLPQPKDVDAMRAERFRDFHPVFRRTTTADIQHHDGNRDRLAAGFRYTPDASIAAFPDGDTYSPDIDRHHFRVRVAHGSCELLLVFR